MDFKKIMSAFAEFLDRRLGHVGVEIKGAEVMILKGAKGDKGDPGDSVPVPGPAGSDGKNGVNGKDGRNGIDGRNGSDGKDGTPGIPGRAGKDGSPDTGKQIVDKINQDTSGKKIQKKHVEGLEELESRTRVAEASSRQALRLGGDTVYIADLSTQTNGVTKAFTIPVTRRTLMLIGSDFPTILLKGNGYSIAGQVLTLTVANAPSSGSQLALLYVI